MTKTKTIGFFCRARALFSGESGMTLIELLSSMVVFLVVSTGIAGSMIVGLRTTSDAQMATMGKDVAQEVIEEIEARPFYVPYSTDSAVGTTADVDFLDVYYPDAMLGTFVDDQGREGWFTESGGDAYFTLVSPADERGIVTTVETRFIDESGNAVSPASTYNSNYYAVDYPSSQLVEITVNTSWQGRNGEDSFTLVTRKSASGQTFGTSVGSDPGGDTLDDTYDGESEDAACDNESGDAESDITPDTDSADNASTDGEYHPDPQDVDGDDETCDYVSYDGESDDTAATDSADDESGGGGYGRN